jgi:hypothetical protein
MTIAYKEIVIIVPREIKLKAKKNTENYYRNQADVEKVKIVLTPNADATKDTVAIIRGQSDKPDILVGNQINSGKQCGEFGIKWWNPAAKKNARLVIL